MKTLTLLRRLKGVHVDRMEALNGLARNENRDLTTTENFQYEMSKSRAELFDVLIGQLEQDLAQRGLMSFQCPA
jgi:hypothetical protein